MFSFTGYSRMQIVKTVKKVMPAVVSISVTEPWKDEKKQKSDRNRKSSRHILADGRVETGGGSGFFIDNSGTVLTNRHVVSGGPDAAFSILVGGKTYAAELVARDPVDDIAILRLRNAREKFPAIPLGDSGKLELGEPVLAVGNALGLFRNTVSAGIISGLSRAVSAQEDPNSPVQELRGLIQTDAAINPGNSGGPLIDISGKAVGINAAVIASAENIGFAIPINAAKRDYRDLQRFGRIRRPLLGLRYLMLNPELKEKLKVGVHYGALVTREHVFDDAVVPGTPAADAGIREGDIILEWNGERVTEDKSIQDFLEDAEVGEVVRLQILRGEKEISVPVTLSERK